MRQTRVFLLALGLCVPGLPSIASAQAPAPSAARDAAKDHAFRGQAYFQQKRFPEAESEYQAALTADPTWYDMMLNLGLTYDAEGRSADALAAFRQYLPHATPDESAALQKRIAELEIQTSDAQRAAKAAEEHRLQAEREAAAAREREAAAQREADRQRTLEALAQVLVVESTDTVSKRHVVAKSHTGLVTRCQPDAELDRVGSTCTLRDLPPGPATLSFETDGGPQSIDIEVPNGHATLGLGYDYVAGRLIGGMLLFTGSFVPMTIGVVDLSEQSHALGGVLLAAGAVGAVGGGYLAFSAIVSQGPTTEGPRPSSTTARAATHLPFAAGVVPLDHGGFAAFRVELP